MNENIFVCPLCQNRLAKKEQILSCNVCKKDYKIINGVFDFSNIEINKKTQKTIGQFARSWEIFSHIEDYYEKQFLDWIYPLTKKDFEGKNVLEAGCGKGRHTKIVLNFKPKHLFAVDLSEAIFLAERLCHKESFTLFHHSETMNPCAPYYCTKADTHLKSQGIEVKKCSNEKSCDSVVEVEMEHSPQLPERRGGNTPSLLSGENRKEFVVTFVRSDLKKLPFQNNFFDLVFCVGVLHHIDKMEEALNELWRVLKPGGKIVLWVYGKEGNFWITYFLNPIRKLITSKLPVKLLRILSFPLSLFLYIILKTTYGPLTKWGKKEIFLYYSSYLGAISPYPFKEIESIVVDHLCPPVAHYLSKQEIKEMLKLLNPSSLTLRWHHKNSWTAVVEKEKQNK